MDNFAPSADLLYPAYQKAEEALLLLDPSQLDSEDGDRVIQEFFEIAKQYASTVFGQRKLVLLECKLQDLEWGKLEKEARIDESKIERKVRLRGLKKDVRIITANEAILFGKKNLKLEEDENYKARQLISDASAFNAPIKTREALVKQDLSVKDFYDSLKISGALGAKILAVDGSTFYRLYTSTGSYEDYFEYTIGYYSSKEAAHIALAEAIFSASEGAESTTPWGLLNDFSNPGDWNTVRLQWFQNATFAEIIDWYCKVERVGEELDIYLVELNITPYPKSTFPLKGLTEVESRMTSSLWGSLY